jgi:alkyl hydroperoxide reductase subunit AhpF
LSGLGEHERESIRAVFEGLDHHVPLLLELGPEESPVTVLAGSREIDFGAETQALLEQLAELSDRLTLTVTEVEEKGSWPRTTVGERLVYRGLPWGFELTTIVGAIAEAGRSTSSLSEASHVALAALEHDVDLEVYVTPTCPHCPPAVLQAYRCALATPRVRAAAVEATEFAAAADRHGVVSVPATVLNGRLAWVGALPESMFVERLLLAAGTHL